MNIARNQDAYFISKIEFFHSKLENNAEAFKENYQIDALMINNSKEVNFSEKYQGRWDYTMSLKAICDKEAYYTKLHRYSHIDLI